MLKTVHFIPSQKLLAWFSQPRSRCCSVDPVCCKDTSGASCGRPAGEPSNQRGLMWPEAAWPSRTPHHMTTSTSYGASGYSSIENGKLSTYFQEETDMF